MKRPRNDSFDNSLILQDAFELRANYTKTKMKGIPYFEQTLSHFEKLIETLG
jgi:hypothetical protein